jgi:chromate transport protein ChrA
VDTPAFMIAVTCFTAPMAAAMLGYIAHYHFGLSRQEIRTPAVVGAAVIAVVIVTLVALDFFRKRPRKR